MTRLAFGLLLALGGCLVATQAIATGPRPGRVWWQSLEFRASKLMVTATAEVTLSEVADDERSQLLLDTLLLEGTARTAEPRVLRLEIESKLLGRTSLGTLWLRADDASALRRVQLETRRGRERQKTYRFGRREVTTVRLTPADPSEAQGPPESWSQRSDESIPLPSDLTGGVIDPTALLYAVSAFPPESFREGLRFLTYAGNAVQEVEVRWTGTETVTTAYEIEGATPGGGDRRRQVEAMVYSAAARALPGSEQQLELLGLKGDLDLIIEVGTLVPLEIRGRLPPVGRVVVRLEKARPAPDPKVPSPIPPG